MSKHTRPSRSPDSQTDNQLSLPQDALPVARALSATTRAAENAQSRMNSDRFREFNREKSDNTLKGYRRDLQRFADMLLTSLVTHGLLTQDELDRAGVTLTTIPALWTHITAAHVKGYYERMLAEGYAVSSCNRALYAMRTYARLAMLSGVLSVQTYDRIVAIHGKDDKQAANINEKRETTRIGHKKADPLPVPADLLDPLLNDHNTETYHGLRAAVIMRLLAELGLRAGELAALQQENINLNEGTVTFYRQKVTAWQTLKLSVKAQRLLRQYMKRFPAGRFLIWKLSSARKPVKNADANGLTPEAISMVVRGVGKKNSLPSLSAHDLRHLWTTTQFKNGVPETTLQRMGGWNSRAMLDTYIADADIANDGHDDPYDV